MIRWSGQPWHLKSGLVAPTIAVIERNAESYAEYHERRKAEESKRSVPFGFARALIDEEPEG